MEKGLAWDKSRHFWGVCLVGGAGWDGGRLPPERRIGCCGDSAFVGKISHVEGAVLRLRYSHGRATWTFPERMGDDQQRALVDLPVRGWCGSLLVLWAWRLWDRSLQRFVWPGSMLCEGFGVQLCHVDRDPFLWPGLSRRAKIDYL